MDCYHIGCDAPATLKIACVTDPEDAIYSCEAHALGIAMDDDVVTPIEEPLPFTELSDEENTEEYTDENEAEEAL